MNNILHKLTHGLQYSIQPQWMMIVMTYEGVLVNVTLYSLVCMIKPFRVDSYDQFTIDLVTLFKFKLKQLLSYYFVFVYFYLIYVLLLFIITFQILLQPLQLLFILSTQYDIFLLLNAPLIRLNIQIIHLKLL